jgi:hypothetical protein
MGTTNTNVFLSCSFSEDDKAINDLVKAICKGMDIDCINVAKGYTQVPPGQAREYIDKSMALVAVVTRRDKLNEQEYAMPASVRDEIGIAYGLQKPLLLIAEKGVRMDGFMQNYGTYLCFTKEMSRDAGFIEQLTASLHKLKVQLTPAHELIVDPELDDFFSESSMGLTELRNVGADNFYWTQSITKKLRFRKPCRHPLKVACWTTQTVSIPENADAIEMQVAVRDGSRDFKLEKTVLKETATEIQASLRIDPAPLENDYLVYTTRYRSKYLYPIYVEDIKHPITLTIDDKKYLCFDGTVPIQPTKLLKCQYRFPAEYQLTNNDLHFYVGSYTTTLNYIVESEMRRAKSTVDSFGGDIIFNIEVDSPLLYHMYGIAWNPPHKRSPGGDT